MQKIIPIILLFGLPSIISQISKGKSHANSTNGFSFHDWTFYILCIGFATLFCKDCMNGQSPGKRALGVQIINLKTKQIATPIRCLVRNLFMILAPIEAVVLLLNPKRRLGDYIAGTELISYNPSLKKEKNDHIEIIISFLIAYLFSVITFQILSKF